MKCERENNPGNFKSDSSCCSVGRLSNNEVALSNVPINSGRIKKTTKFRGPNLSTPQVEARGSPRV